MQMRSWDLPGERKNLFGKFSEQGRLRGVGQHQDDVDVSRSELDQVAGVGHIRQLRHFHKVFLRRTAAQQMRNMGKKMNFSIQPTVANLLIFLYIHFLLIVVVCQSWSQTLIDYKHLFRPICETRSFR